MSASIAAPAVRFHLSLNVTDVDRAVEFYSVAFGTEPAKRRADYAKFELDEPPLVLSLEAAAPQPGGAFNHAGFRMEASEQLVALQRRLEESGVSTIREDGVECCYARQTKFWLQDPDGNLWEFYVLEGDIEHRGDGHVPAVMQQVDGDLLASGELPMASAGGDACCAGGACSSSPAAAARKTVRHFLGQPLEILRSAAPGAANEVFLQGTFNAAIDDRQERQALDFAFAALSPGGVVRIHCLTATRTPEGPLSLTGPAAVVQRTPLVGDLLARIGGAGFVAAELTQYRGSASFVAGGVELRETMLVARKPASISEADDVSVEVLYKGPYEAVTLDSGAMLVRGRATRLPAAEWNAVRGTELARNVVELETSSATACS